MMGGGGGTIAPPTTAWAVVTLIIYSVALLGISLWLFKKRDITA
jgi:ABC-type transport system involved in multi-copper enzyme maturation permease subunit